MVEWLWKVAELIANIGLTFGGQSMRRIKELERQLGLHEGGWVQLMIGRRVVWMTRRAYDACYVGLDDNARARVDRALVDSGQGRFDLADLKELSK